MDFSLKFVFWDFIKEITENQWNAMVYFFYFSLGIWIADYIYRFKKFALITVLSIFTLFALKYFLISIYKPALVNLVMVNTIAEVVPKALIIL